MFKLPIRPNEKLEPYVKADVWDQNHVRMPHSEGSKYEEIDEHGVKSVLTRWNLIERSLLTKFENSFQLEIAIKKYNTRYEQLWDFSSFHHLVQTELTSDQRQYFFTKLLPDIISLALRIDQIIMCPIPLLKQKINHSISMTQEQACCLLANAFLCTFPRRNTEKRNSEFSNYPEINFNRLFGNNAQKNREKLKCILNYFKRVLKASPSLDKGVITFQRRCLNDFPEWKDDSRKLSDINYQVSACDSIEAASGCLQVDFANKFIGGGVLGGGSVQEEIRFITSPELIVAKLFSESLDDDEAIIITGTEQFNSYLGYGSTFQFAGDFYDTTPTDDFNRRKTRIVAMDALSYTNFYNQFKEVNLKRDINKAYVGFYNNENEDRQPVATGLWGAGAFQGHPIRSAIIQFMACRATRRNLVFYTFNDKAMEFQVADIFEFLSMNNVTISAVYEILKKFRYSQKTSNVEELVPFIKKEVIASAKNTSTSQFQSQKLNGGKFKPNLFSFKQPNSSHVQSFQPAKKSENDINFLRFNDTKTANDQARFDTIEANCKFFNSIQKEEKSPQPPRRSLLESLDDDFGK